MTKFLQWTITLAIPFMLAAFMIGIAINPWYPRWEYAKSSFPPDVYGWTQDQRLELALVSVEFLSVRGSAEDTIFMLEEQTFPDSDELLFTPNEVSHMFDVKVRTNLIRRLGIVLAIIVVGGVTYLLRWQPTERTAYISIRNGGIATIAILAFFGVAIGLFWEWFFTTFHEVLFPAGNWAFPYSSSLIRLFPDEFWFDVGVVIVGGTFVLGVFVAIIGHFLVRNAISESA